MTDKDNAPTILCLGETLWHFLPDGLFAGGAPFNVGYHLHQNQCHACVVSAVGRDLLGEELLRRLRVWGIATHFVAELEAKPTGYVRAEIGSGGDAKYTITEDVAWDAIPVDDALLATAAKADAIVFGSLAQRSPVNRKALDTLLAALSAETVRIFDVNLRPPYDDLALVGSLAKRATVIKLNNDEAARLAGNAKSPGDDEANARAIAGASGCDVVCVTGGARGAGLLDRGSWHWEDGRKVDVADTVGSGDSFLAALTAGLLRKDTPTPEVLARACRLGEWVASQRGATPAYDQHTPV